MDFVTNLRHRCRQSDDSIFKQNVCQLSRDPNQDENRNLELEGSNILWPKGKVAKDRDADKQQDKSEVILHEIYQVNQTVIFLLNLSFFRIIVR